MSKIVTQSLHGEALVFQGAEPGAAWSLTVDNASGAVTLSAAGNGVAYHGFGACTRL